MTEKMNIVDIVAELLARMEAPDGLQGNEDGMAIPGQEGIGLYSAALLVGLADAGWSSERFDEIRSVTAGLTGRIYELPKDSPDRAALDAELERLNALIRVEHFEERGTLKIIQAAAAGQLIASGKDGDRKRRRIPARDWEGAVWFVPRVDSEGCKYWHRPHMADYAGPRVNPIDDPQAHEDAMNTGEENDIYALQGLVGTLAKDDWSKPDWYDIRLSPQSVKRLFGLTSAATVAGEQKAIAEAVDMLKKNTDTPRDAVIRMAQENHGVSYRGAKDRVWPTARERAGLPRSAPAGRKKGASG